MLLNHQKAKLVHYLASTCPIYPWKFYLEINKSLDVSPKFTIKYSIEDTDLKKEQT